MIEVVIFDMDGVLVDSEPFHVEIEKRQFKLNGLEILDEEHHRFMGVASDVMWRELARTHLLGLPVEKLIEQNKAESIRYFSELDDIPVMPGLIELLEKLQQKNYPMAVASSSFPEIIDLVLDKTQLREYFQAVVSSKEAGKSKPEPDVFLLAAQKLGVQPENCLVIEDSKNGIKAAKAAGMQCIAFQGPGANPMDQQLADTIIREFSDLEQMFLKVGRNGR